MAAFRTDRGKHTLRVPAEPFVQNRKRLAERLRTTNKVPAESYVLLQGGESETRHCSDHEPIFRQESYFHWAFGVEDPDFYGAIEVDTGRGILFPPKLPDAYAVWMGKLLETKDFQLRYGVDEAYWSEDLAKVLKEKKASLLLTLRGLNTDRGNYSREPAFDGISEFIVDNAILHPEISECIFNHYCQFNGGIRLLAYTCICGSGDNGSVLHYGHAGAPNAKKVMDGDMCLLDMGGESDITCSDPANGKFTQKQRGDYETVYKSSRAVMAALKPGVSWVDMHLLADRVHLGELKKLGLVKGDVEEMMKVRSDFLKV
uniref:Xaa-Pro dipeptidase n=1 Tax=Crassostrea virginica TaxID=6565 RepID=A0A8B8EQM9_CRAVI|nr:xaa-Pro dipeptidase-like [Crassostrea virginica]